MDSLTDVTNPNQNQFQVGEFIRELRESRPLDYRAQKNLMMEAESFGKSIFQKSAQKNRHLQLSLQNAVLSGQSLALINGLNDLNQLMKELDPSRVDFNPGFFKRLFNPLSSYFEQFELREEDLSRTLRTIQKGKSILANDTITLGIEQEALKKMLAEIEQALQTGEDLAERLKDLLFDLRFQMNSADKIDLIEQQILPLLEQRIFDLKQLYIVCQQQIFSIETIQTSNRQLLRAIDRAQGITLTALQTAVILASSLNNQKIILDKIQNLEMTTEKFLRNSNIKRTGAKPENIKPDGDVTSDSLKRAFEDTFEALDDLEYTSKQARVTLNRSLDELQKSEQQ